jgi:glycolate oxidase FAD binding subunit
MNNGVLTELGDYIRSQSKLLAVCGGSKDALRIPQGASALDMKEITGIIEYEPSEFTFTAFSGTRLEEVDSMLRSNGQFLPFDPPFAKRGATLGGTVAAGLSGSGRYRYGGLRDFILGIKYFDYQGQLIRSGGKVVKNAAGFDMSKLMVGSLGGFGALVELSFKVFPRPTEYWTLSAKYPTLRLALDKLIRLSALPMEIDSLDLEPRKSDYILRIRLGGESSLFPKRIEQLEKEIGEYEILKGNSDTDYWEKLQEFSWLPEGNILIKIPLTINQVPDLEGFLLENKSIRRYSTGANVAWISWAGSLDKLDQFLLINRLAGLTLLGSAEKTKLGDWNTGEFYQRIKKALDPSGKWAEV